MYDRRDLIGHWVRKSQRTDQMCTHACCRGYRVHPRNMPVVLPDRLLRRASDKDLEKHYADLGESSSAGADEGRMQILWELDRRENEERRAQVRKTEAAERRAEREQRRRDRYSATRAADRMERESLAELAYVEAEVDTRGNMLNKRGRAAGVDPRSLFTGPQSRARAYASEELLEHWKTHPRPTAAMYQGRDTRVYELYTAPLKRRRRAA